MGIIMHTNHIMGIINAGITTKLAVPSLPTILHIVLKF